MRRGYDETNESRLPAGSRLSLWVVTAGLCLGDGSYIDEATAFFAAGEYHRAVNERVDGVILTHAYVQAGMMHCATLALDDVASFGELTAKNLNTESFAFRLTAVLGRTYTFLMCHFE